MNICVLTYHHIPNFGANLQALATVKYLNRLGHNVTVLNYRPHDLAEAYARSVDSGQIAVHESFADEYLPQSRVCRTGTELATVVRESSCDAIIVGSDAVFNLKPYSSRSTHNYPNPFWLGWLNDMTMRERPKTATLAASCMGSILVQHDWSVRKKMGADLRSFDYLSVRDRWTKWMVMCLALRNPRLTVDPTAVLDDVFQVPEVYRIPRQLEGQEYIVLTMSDGLRRMHWVKQLAEECHKRNLLLCHVPHPERGDMCEVEFTVPQPLHPLRWYNIMLNASGYIGERFHPIAISLFHGNPVLAIDRYSHTKSFLKKHVSKHRSKTRDICRSAGITEHCVPHDIFWSEWSPRTAVEMLVNVDRSKLMSFAQQSKREFSRNIIHCLQKLDGRVM